MDKGIRPAAIRKFAELLPRRAELGNTRFRAEVRFYLIEEFGITGAAASTHYNHAFQKCKAEAPELVQGLGRPEGKNNGGRKRKLPLQGELDFDGEATAEVETAEAVAEEDPNDAGETAPEQTVFTVKKKSTGEEVAVGLSFDDAKALIAKAAAAKKAKLYAV